MEDKKYYEIEYKDLIKGVTFKFRKLNPIDHLNLVTTESAWKKQHDDFGGIIKMMFKNILWTKTGETWVTLADDDGDSTLPELDDNIGVCLDLFYLYREKVLAPVFTESKTYQNLLKQVEEEETTK